jgi:hypothetical protein
VQEYADKKSLTSEIRKTASLFIGEFEDVRESDKDTTVPGIDRTPARMISYQLGWMALLRKWDEEELSGHVPELPAPGLKWNALGKLYQRFYDEYSRYSLAELSTMFKDAVNSLCFWMDGFSEEEVFKIGGRKWASSTPSNWPIWKWIHINTVAPFKSFRSKIRKWKKLREVQKL